MFDAAVLRAHRAVVGGGGRQVVLNLTETLDDVKSALGTIAPNLADKIPPGDEVQVRVFDKTQLDTIYDITNLTKKAVVVVTILALLFLAGGVALSSRRWKTLALAGWVTLGVFAFSLIGVVSGRIITGSFVKRDEFRPGVEAAYRIITRGLIVQAFVLGILGLLVALAAGWIDRHGGWASAREAMGKGTAWARQQLPKKAPATPVDATTGIGLATAARARAPTRRLPSTRRSTAGEIETADGDRARNPCLTTARARPQGTGRPLVARRRPSPCRPVRGVQSAQPDLDRRGPHRCRSPVPRDHRSHRGVGDAAGTHDRRRTAPTTIPTQPSAPTTPPRSLPTRDRPPSEVNGAWWPPSSSKRVGRVIPVRWVRFLPPPLDLWLLARFEAPSAPLAARFALMASLARWGQAKGTDPRTS